MCNIAGYVGTKRAAPILIEMLKRQQYYDGGAGTGIATIHNGILYQAKVVGDVDELLRTTDALNFPGTIGIAHSRPGGIDVEHMHPFTDASQKLALVANGMFSTTNTPEYMECTRRLMHGYFAKGVPIRSMLAGSEGKMFTLPNGTHYHGTESYALRTGELCDEGNTLCRSLATALSERPNGFVAVAIHADEPDQIAIGKMDRPMTVGIVGGETYLATTQFGFPEDMQFDAIIRPPEGIVCRATAGELTVTRHRIENMHMEPVTVDIYKRAYDLIEGYLRGQKENPKNLWDMERKFETEWRFIWQEPYCDCIFRKEPEQLFKPYAELMYCILYAMHKEGKLHRVTGTRKNAEGEYKMYYFYLD